MAQLVIALKTQGPFRTVIHPHGYKVGIWYDNLQRLINPSPNQNGYNEVLLQVPSLLLSIPPQKAQKPPPLPRQDKRPHTHITIAKLPSSPPSPPSLQPDPSIPC